MGTITSRTNPRVRDAVRLHRRRDRHERGQWLAEGPHPVRAALDAGVVETLFVTNAASASTEVETLVVADTVMDRLVTTRTHQGVAAVCRRPSAPGAIHPDRAYVCLLAASDPGNVGTAIRTVAHAGLGGVLLTGGSADPFGPRAVRAAAGALPGTDVHEDVDVEGLVASVPPERVVALDTGGTRSIFEPLPDAPILLFGSEAHGLPPMLLEQLSDVRVIPGAGGHRGVDSLNLAAAVAVAAYAAATFPTDR